MTSIKASTLKDVIRIHAAIVVSDGRWDQWSDLLLKQLKTIGEWKPGKWTTTSDFYLYTFQPKGRGKLADGTYIMGSIQLAFVDSGSGNNYEFSHAAFISKVSPLPQVFAYGAAAAKKYRKGAKIANGKDLIGAIAADMGISLTSPGNAATSTSSQPAPKPGAKLYMMSSEFWDYVFNNSPDDGMDIVGSIDSDLSAGVEVAINSDKYAQYGLSAKPTKAQVKKAIQTLMGGVGKIGDIEIDEDIVLAQVEFTSKDVQKLASDYGVTIGKNKKGDPVVV